MTSLGLTGEPHYAIFAAKDGQGGPGKASREDAFRPAEAGDSFDIRQGRSSQALCLALLFALSENRHLPRSWVGSQGAFGTAYGGEAARADRNRRSQV